MNYEIEGIYHNGNVVYGKINDNKIILRKYRNEKTALIIVDAINSNKLHDYVIYKLPRANASVNQVRIYQKKMKGE